MEIINNLKIEEELKKLSDGSCIEDGYTFFFMKPTRMDDLPIVDESKIDKNKIEIYTPEMITSFFEEIYDNNCRLRSFNGLVFGESPNYFSDCYYCDYCHTSMEKDGYYCYHCYSDMCKLCFEETSEEVAIKNGAKNYKDREEKLNNCRNCNLLEERPIRMKCIEISSRNCDVCRKKDIEKENFYTVDENDNTYDICLECYDTNNDNAQETVKEKKMTFLEKDDKSRYMFYYTDMGSLLFWIPILRDKNEEPTSILMNLNPDDKNYKKICFHCIDNHGRSGFYIVKNDTINLDTLIEILDKLSFKDDDEKNGDEEAEAEEESDYDEEYCQYPINQLMGLMNMPTYYG